MTTPTITVVVPVLNEERFLEQTLRSLRAQTFQEYELLVVDNGSTDRSPEIAAELADQVIIEPRRGYLPAAHRGFSEARSAFVVTADADTLYPPQWLAWMARALGTPGTVAAYGPMGFRESWALLRPLEVAGYCVLAALSRLCGVPLCGGANLGIRRDAYFAVGGYPPLEERASPDFRLARALRTLGRVRFVPHMPCYTSNRRFVRVNPVWGTLQALWYWFDVATGRDRIPGARYWTVPDKRRASSAK